MNRSSFVSKLFTPVITLLVLAYFGYQIYGYVSDPFSTTLAYTYQVEDTVDISGYVVRQEQVLTGDAGGLMRLRKNEGERVGTGGAVATVYAHQASLDRQNEIETLNNRIEQLEYAQESMLGAEVTLKLDSQIARSLLDYRTVVAAGRLDAAESRGQELRSLVLKRDYTYSGTEDLSGQLQELKNQLKTLRSQAANSVKTIRSPRSGLFSAVVDGYESVLTPDSLSALAARWGHKYAVVGPYQDNYPVAVTSRFPIKVVQRIGDGLSHGAIPRTWTGTCRSRFCPWARRKTAAVW